MGVIATNSVTTLAEVMPSLMSQENNVRSAAEVQYERLKLEAPDELSTALLQALSTSPDEERRAFAAVLASRAFSELWERLAGKTKDGVKQQLLAQIQSESVPHIARKVGSVLFVCVTEL